MPSGCQRQHFFGRRVRRDHSHPQAVRGQPAQDVVLDAKVVGHDVRHWPGTLSSRVCRTHLPAAAACLVVAGGNRRPRRARGVQPVICLLAGDLAHQVATVQPFPAARQRQQLLDVTAAVGGERRPQHALLAQQARQRARVHLADARDAVACQVVGQRLVGAPVRHHGADLAHDESRHLRPVGLHVLGVDARVADMRQRHAHHLAAVGGIGDHLLVAGQAGVEDHFAHHCRLRRQSPRRAAPCRPPAQESLPCAFFPAGLRFRRPAYSCLPADRCRCG